MPIKHFFLPIFFFVHCGLGQLFAKVEFDLPQSLREQVEARLPSANLPSGTDWLLTTREIYYKKYGYIYQTVASARFSRYVPVYCPPYRASLLRSAEAEQGLYLSTEKDFPRALKQRRNLRAVSSPLTPKELCALDKKRPRRQKKSPLVYWMNATNLSLDFELYHTGGNIFLEESYPYGATLYLLAAKDKEVPSAEEVAKAFRRAFDSFGDFKNLLFAGDMMFSRGNSRYYKNKPSDFPFEKVRHWLASADFVSANLETSLSKRGKKHMPFKGIYFRDDPKWAKGLKKAGIEFITLANNHSLDYGKNAFEDTIRYLKQENLKPFGFIRPGETFQKAACESGYCFLGYNFVPPWEYQSTKGGPGVPWPFQKNIARDIKNNSHEYMVVQLHGNKEYKMFPTALKYRFAREAIDSGADLFVGHHPHWIQGWERYKGKLIFYSMGNFIFDQYWSEMTQYGILARVFVKNGQTIGYMVHPYRISGGQPRPLYTQEKQFLSEKLIQMANPQKIRKNLVKDIYKMPPQTPK